VTVARNAVTPEADRATGEHSAPPRAPPTVTTRSRPFAAALAVLALVLAGDARGASVPGAPAGPQRGGRPAGTLERLARRSHPLDEGERQELSRELDRVLARLPDAPASRRDVNEALLELAELGLEARCEGDPARARSGDWLCERLAAAWPVAVDADTAAWLVRDVLIAAGDVHESRRAAAALALGHRREQEVTLALLHSTRGGMPLLEECALRSLVGRDDRVVDEVFAKTAARVLGAGAADEAAEETGSRRGARRASRSRTTVQAADPLREERLALWTEAHLNQSPPLDDPELADELAQLVQRGLASGNWREASRAVALAAPIPHEVAVPVLIEALELWADRRERGWPSRRISAELALELEHRSGRRIGPHPRRWRSWWEAVQEGRAEPPLPGDAPDPSSRATFFGLRPASDRVVFLIDRSGSMTAPLRVDAEQGLVVTRYAEAIEQLTACLAGLGEHTRFDVVLYNDRPLSWRSELVPADDANLEAVRRWLQSYSPQGGNDLRAAVAEAMHLDAGGEPDLDALEADTLVVLCDGDTLGGLQWAPEILRRSNLRARLVFDCVQIGGESDGALELLAAGSAGRMVVVD